MKIFLWGNLVFRGKSQGSPLLSDIFGVLQVTFNSATFTFPFSVFSQEFSRHSGSRSVHSLHVFQGGQRFAKGGECPPPKCTPYIYIHCTYCYNGAIASRCDSAWNIWDTKIIYYGSSYHLLGYVGETWYLLTLNTHTQQSLFAYLSTYHSSSGNSTPNMTA